MGEAIYNNQFPVPSASLEDSRGHGQWKQVIFIAVYH